MRKRRIITFQEFLVEGRNHSYTAFYNNVKRRIMSVQAVLAAVNKPRITSIWLRLRSDAWFVIVLFRDSHLPRPKNGPGTQAGKERVLYYLQAHGRNYQIILH